MGILALAILALCWIFYLYKVKMPQDLWVWEKVAENHPSRRELALAQIIKIRRWQKVAGGLLVLQFVVVLHLISVHWK
jgi:hypothetical protein